MRIVNENNLVPSVKGALKHFHEKKSHIIKYNLRVDSIIQFTKINNLL